MSIYAIFFVSVLFLSIHPIGKLKCLQPRDLLDLETELFYLSLILKCALSNGVGLFLESDENKNKKSLLFGPKWHVVEKREISVKFNSF